MIVLVLPQHIVEREILHWYSNRSVYDAMRALPSPVTIEDVRSVVGSKPEVILCHNCNNAIDRFIEIDTHSSEGYGPSIFCFGCIRVANSLVVDHS